MAKLMARSWKGGMVPLAAVNRASVDQSSTARKPTSVAVFWAMWCSGVSDLLTLFASSCKVPQVEAPTAAS